MKSRTDNEYNNSAKDSQEKVSSDTNTRLRRRKKSQSGGKKTESRRKKRTVFVTLDESHELDFANERVIRMYHSTND